MYDNLDEIDIQYPEVNVNNSLLYAAKEKLPQKINIGNIASNNNKNTLKKTNYILHEIQTGVGVLRECDIVIVPSFWSIL